MRLSFDFLRVNQTAYVLDVRDRFPQTPGTVPVSLSDDTVSPWRKRAIMLECDLEELRAKYESDHISTL
jgi:hypothetical protein